MSGISQQRGAYAYPAPLHGDHGNAVALSQEAKANVTQAFDAFMAQISLPQDSPGVQKLLTASPDMVDASVAIVAEAARLNMDLIVMALGKISFFEQFIIGAVTERVIRNLPCTLLALPTTWARRH